MANITVGYLADGTPCDYTTIASAYSAANEYDTLQIYYKNTAKSHIWFEVFGDISSKLINIQGMLSNPQVTFHPGNNDFLAVSGDVSAKNKITWSNFIIVGPHNHAGYTIFVNNTGSSVGNGFDVHNIIAICGGTYGFAFTGTTGKVYNCFAIKCYSIGFYVTKNTSTGVGGTNEVYFCTAIGNRLYGIENRNNSPVTIKNCISLLNANTDLKVNTGGVGATTDYCACGSYNGNIGAHVLTGQTVDDAQFMTEHANGFNIYDYRIHTSSNFVGQGIAISGITTDIDGQTRADPPTIGASEGVESFGPESTDPGESNVLAPTAYKINGVDKVGTFDEAARNTDPGVANVLAPTAYKIQNVDKVGTFDESARNTDPGETNVKQGTTYKILNADKTGTYNPLGNPPAVSVSAANDENGTSATITFTATSGATAKIYLKVSGSWVLQDTQVATGNAQTSTVSTPKGLAYFKVTAENAGGINAECVSVFVEDTSAVAAYYRVIGIEQMPSADYKRVILERVDAPINPNVS